MENLKGTAANGGGYEGHHIKVEEELLSPTMYVDSGDTSIGSTPTPNMPAASRHSPPPLSLFKKAIEEEMLMMMTQGSEDESAVSDDDDAGLSITRMPRLIQILQKTPEDPDDVIASDGEPASTSLSPAPAPEAVASTLDSAFPETGLLKRRPSQSVARNGRRGRARGGSSRRRGRGGRSTVSTRPTVGRKIEIVNVEDLPRGTQLETAIIPPQKRRRVWTPSQRDPLISVPPAEDTELAGSSVFPSPSDTRAAEDAEEMVEVWMPVDTNMPLPAFTLAAEDAEELVEVWMPVDVKLPLPAFTAAAGGANEGHLIDEVEAPSPAFTAADGGGYEEHHIKVEEEVLLPTMFVDCGDTSMGSTPTTNMPATPIRSPPPQALFENVIEEEMLMIMTQGSEEESAASDDDDDAGLTITRMPRLAQILQETPEDPDDIIASDCEPASSSFSPAPAPEAVASILDSAFPETGLLYGPTHFLDFNWTAFPDVPTPPELRREVFAHSKGATTSLYDPYDLFVAIWDREFLSHIVTETNRYAQQTVARMMADNTLHPSSRICDWVDTSVDELYTYFALVLAMGVVVRSQMVEYWNTAKNVFCTPGFRVYMTLRRFQLLTRLVHFTNSEELCTRNLDASEAKLFKVQPILDHLNRRFSDMYEMRQNIALDESLLQWKGWLDINQFIPNKAAAVGIKSYEVCESQTGYLWRFEIHANNKTATQQNLEGLPDLLQASTPVLVLRLLQGLEFRGHTVWMDNFYNSPALARKLKTLGFDCVGTLRTNQQLVPVELTNLTKASMRPGQITGVTSGDVDLMVWRDQNRVAMISTYHGNAVSTENGVVKPILIRDYNICMGGVDKKDQMLATYPVERKRTIVWYKKLFRRLLNVSILNSFIIHKQSSTATPLTHRNFRMQLVLSLLDKHSTPSNSTICDISTRDATVHFPAEYRFVPQGRQRLRRTCVVCKVRRTHTYCSVCDKAVCVFRCWLTLHTSTQRVSS